MSGVSGVGGRWFLPLGPNGVVVSRGSICFLDVAPAALIGDMHMNIVAGFRAMVPLVARMQGGDEPLISHALRGSCNYAVWGLRGK